ncbi:hypothetical protein OO009_11305 [Flavobacteriaceae bacterium KMM 6897]|nr:hypothetical protein [Flavobacteriaceae bacterium KMM 6897]MEB8344911.1 hypothetical protein [Flavobacteriaceae bacterium KMM 6898]
MKNKNIFALVLVAMIFIQCEKADKEFLITPDSVGMVTRTTRVSDLEALYEKDSVVLDTNVSKLTSSQEKIQVFEKGGVHLLTLTPNTDSIPTVENIRIYDPRFVSEKGVGLQSTFKDIKDNYTIDKIVTSMNNVVIFLSDSDMYITIDKEELPESLRYAAAGNIEAVQIPDVAKIKYIMVGWD